MRKDINNLQKLNIKEQIAFRLIVANLCKVGNPSKYKVYSLKNIRSF